jgi:hypothetical protein
MTYLIVLAIFFVVVGISVVMFAWHQRSAKNAKTDTLVRNEAKTETEAEVATIIFERKSHGGAWKYVTLNPRLTAILDIEYGGRLMVFAGSANIVIWVRNGVVARVKNDEVGDICDLLSEEEKAGYLEFFNTWKMRIIGERSFEEALAEENAKIKVSVDLSALQPPK